MTLESAQAGGPLGLPLHFSPSTHSSPLGQTRGEPSQVGLLPSAQGLGLGGFVARVPSEQVHDGATPSEHMGPLAKAEASMRVKRSWGSILAYGELHLCAGSRAGRICRCRKGRQVIYRREGRGHRMCQMCTPTIALKMQSL